jgi:non-ribosomal peptide synthetase component F
MYLEGPSTLKNDSKVSIRDLLIELFERTPSEHICVVLDKDELTIEMLSKCARRISILLSNESLVAICMDLSLELIIVLCGLILCGVPYIPLEPRLPRERLSYILDDSEASIVITTDESNDSLLNVKTKVISYKDLMLDNTVKNKTCPNRIIDEEDIFCIMYTSGSTGRPKGVRLPYRALFNRLSWQWKMFPFDVKDVCCLKTSISFVDSIAEIFGPLLQRIRLLVIPKSLLLDVNQLIFVLTFHCVTRIILVPSLLTVLLEYLSIQNKKMTNLRFIICSGETLSPNLIESFFDTFESNCQLLNLYGSTEVMADVTFEVFSSRDDLNIKCIDGRTSIGKPIDNMRVDILDPDDDGIGELLVSGDGVASGYHHGEMLTDKFLPDPNNKEKLCFRTGDMGKIWNERIILFGRSDNQVSTLEYIPHLQFYPSIIR